MTSQNAEDLYGYKPNTIANGFFLAIFSLCLLVSLAITAWTRRCIFSSFVLICANVFAIVSYAERIVGSSVGHYIIDNIFAQLGPVFTTIGIHVCATKIIRILGAEHSLLRPKHYARLFVTLTVIAGIIEVFGLAISFADATLYALGSLANVGRWIVLGGVALQLLTLVACLVFLGVVFVRAAKAQRQYGYTTFHRDQGYVPLNPRFKTFLAILPLVAASLLGNRLYRIAFFYGGLRGSVAQSQPLYIGCESILLTEATMALMIFHPSLWLDDGKGTGDEKESQQRSRDVEENLGEVSRLIFKAKAQAAASEASSEEVTLTPSEDSEVSEVSDDTSSQYSR